jgi:RHS repeat-associated protein
VQRYGFNGKEVEVEVLGNGSCFDFGARMSDPKLGGRFLSLDPLGKMNASSSQYSFAGNSPIIAVDFNGLFKIEIALTEEEKTKYPNAALAITRITNIVNHLNYLLEVERTVETSSGGKQVQTVLNYLHKETGLSEDDIVHQISQGNGPTIRVGQVAFHEPASTENSNSIVFDIDALHSLGNPDLTESQLADLVVYWGLTNGALTGQTGQPDGIQDFRRAQIPWMHRGRGMEAEFFGKEMHNTTNDIVNPHTGNIEAAGMGYGDMSGPKRAIGMSDRQLIVNSAVQKSNPVRRSYASF